MARTKADQLEETLQQMAQGKRIEGGAAFVETAQLLSALAEPPPPPRQLSAGRQRFLAEAARIRAMKTARRRPPVWRMGNVRLAGALLAAILVIGMVFVGQATAHSLPGTPLYGLKQITEQARIRMTTDPEARASLATALAEERLEEITALLEHGQVPDEAIPEKARAQLFSAFEIANQLQGEAAPPALERLATMIEAQEEILVQGLSGLQESEQMAVRELLREMERLRRELRPGQGEPNGEQERLHPSTPAHPTDLPGAVEPTASPRPTKKPALSPASEPTKLPTGPKPTEKPSSRPGPRPTDPATGPEPTEKPASGPAPQPTDPSRGPQPTEEPSAGAGPQPTASPAGPDPTDEPSQSPRPQPTDPDAESNPTDEPGHGPGSQATDPPAGPDQTDEPGQGPGPQPSGEPGGGGEGGGGGRP